MKPLPWSSVRTWSCVRCGECCKLMVQLTTREWLNLTAAYGYGIIKQEIGRFFLRKTIDDQCPFLKRTYDAWQCRLQAMKPLVCKLWPFRVLTAPKYGYQNEACFNYRDNKFYVYAIPYCRGISWGRPRELFVKKTLPELIDIRIGVQERQRFTTS